jgi:glycolate oxidase FAD binding subunit
VSASSTFTPEKAPQIAEVVAWAVSESKPLEIIGHGSKRSIGRVARSGATLDTRNLTGVTLYEADELVLSARAGTPMWEIRKLLSDNRQEMAFEPPDLAVALGGTAGSGTLGGTIAANLSGPRRIKAGAARDHFLGFTAVSGRGDVFKSGGRVVKNVTGYDLCKVLAGSWGTLAVMSDITIKVLPAAETEVSIVISGPTEVPGVQAMCEAMGSACEVSGACHLPRSSARASSIASDVPLTLLRLEGVEASVRYRADMLARLTKPYGATEILDDAASRSLWRQVRDVSVLDKAASHALWRLSVPPAVGAKIFSEISAKLDVGGILDWSGGLIWLETPMQGDAGAALIRAAVAAHGGHATLYRASEAMRASDDVFQASSPGIDALSNRLRQGFDPAGVLNPGRMQASI